MNSGVSYRHVGVGINKLVSHTDVVGCWVLEENGLCYKWVSGVSYRHVGDGINKPVSVTEDGRWVLEENNGLCYMWVSIVKLQKGGMRKKLQKLSAIESYYIRQGGLGGSTDGDDGGQ